MTLPHERSRAVIETGKFLRELLTNEQTPVPIRREARALLRHFPSADQVFSAAWQERADPHLVLEPIFDMSIDGFPSPDWPAPPERQIRK